MVAQIPTSILISRDVWIRVAPVKLGHADLHRENMSQGDNSSPRQDSEEASATGVETMGERHLIRRAPGMSEGVMRRVDKMPKVPIYCWFALPLKMSLQG